MSDKGYYTRFIRLVVGLSLLVSLMVFTCLLIGAQSSGKGIGAFTTSAYETTDVWIMDNNRMQFVHLHVSGHKDDIPVWSTQERQISYFPRP